MLFLEELTPPRARFVLERGAATGPHRRHRPGSGRDVRRAGRQAHSAQSHPGRAGRETGVTYHGREHGGSCRSARRATGLSVDRREPQPELPFLHQKLIPEPAKVGKISRRNRFQQRLSDGLQADRSRLDCGRSAINGQPNIVLSTTRPIQRLSPASSRSRRLLSLQEARFGGLARQSPGGFLQAQGVPDVPLRRLNRYQTHRRQALRP